MFFTYRCSEIHIPKLLKDSHEVQCWTTTYTHGDNYWFYVVCKTAFTNDELEPTPKNFIISKAADLGGLLENPTVNLSEIYLVSPSHMNGGNEWRMNLLKEIRQGEERLSQAIQSAYFFITESDEVYIDSALGNDEIISNIETMYMRGTK